jgi:predicted CXXCH cytochrome family protein
VFTALLIIGIAAMLVFQPKSANALNPNHNCDNCHNLHQAPGQALGKFGVVEDLCLSCHGPAGTATRKAEVHTNKSGSSYPAFSLTCMDCHNPHDNRQNYKGTTNIMMMGKRLDVTKNAKISTPNSGVRDVVFINRGSNADPPYDSSEHSFASGDADGDGKFEGACEVCHTQVSHHRNYDDGDPSHDHTHWVGSWCTDCHPHASSFAPAGGGSCDACHSAIFNTEFNQPVHHLGSSAVTEADCAICHQEPTDNHGNGNIDLKDPDTGNPLTITFPRGAVRNLANSPTTDTLEADKVRDLFCLKCHDGDGAQAVATPATPFSSGNPVLNVWAQFDPTQNSHHAARAAVNNPYCSTTTMLYSWMPGSTITCYDCHETTGHGSANQRMLRTSVDFDSMAAGSSTAAIALAVQDFCTQCHDTLIYKDGGAGSRFTSHNVSKHVSNSDNLLGCMGCHAGIFNDTAIPDNGSAPGNVHGRSFPWPSQSPTSGTISDHFMVGGYINGWVDGGCYGGNCNHSNKAKGY